MKYKKDKIKLVALRMNENYANQLKQIARIQSVKEEKSINFSELIRRTMEEKYPYKK